MERIVVGAHREVGVIEKDEEFCFNIERKRMRNSALTSESRK